MKRIERLRPRRGSAWWVAVPGAAALAYRLYETIKERAEARRGGAQPPTRSSGLPPLWPRLEGWLEIVWPPARSEGEPGAPSRDAPTPAPSSRRFRPSHLTLLTGIAVVTLTVLAGSHSAAWISWTQMVLLGALIGIGTNWVAIKMLFRPHRRYLGVIQGVVPANRERIVRQISRGVSDHLLDRDTIHRAVHESDVVGAGLDDLVAGLQRLVAHSRFRGDVEELLVAYVGAFVEDEGFRQRMLEAVGGIARRAPERLGGVLGMFSKEIGSWLESMVHEHRDAILAGLEDQVPQLVSETSSRLLDWLRALPDRLESRRGAIEDMITENLARRAADFDVEGLVRRRLDAFSTDELERLILSATDEQLAWLQYLGWIIGAAAAPAVVGLEALVRLL